MRAIRTRPTSKLVTRLLAVAGVFVLLLGGAGHAQDDPDISGGYALSGGWFGERVEARLVLRKQDDGTYFVTRGWTFLADGSQGPALSGLGRVDQVRTRAPSGNRWTHRVRLQVELRQVAGATEHLSNVFSGGASDDRVFAGTYWVYDQGERIAGRVRVPGKDGDTVVLFETGEPDPDADDASSDTDADAAAEDDAADDGEDEDGQQGPVRILFPDGAAYLVGEVLEVRTQPREATLEVVSGTAAITTSEAGTHLHLSQAGEVVLRATAGEESSDPLTLRAVPLEVVELTVLDTIALEDAPPPHFARKVGDPEGQHQWEPAAILKDRPLRVRATFAAAEPVRRPANLRITASDGELELAGDVSIQGQRATATLVSSDVLTDKVKVLPLDLTWTATSVGQLATDPEGEPVALNGTPLRVYTIYRAPVDNPMPRYAPSARQGLPLKTKLHLELACEWANGAGQNIGEGSDSIAHNIDNRYRNHVAWVDYGANQEWVPPVPHYPEGTPPPANYADLEGRVYQGKRSISYVYYPSADDPKPYANYDFYRNNFGWWVLDNPTHTGGRCNQQAALICDILGTVGIRAQVYYIERVAVGRQTGRPLRRYYRSSRSTKSWNFHGQAEVFLEDGSRWLYDGTGSSPPNRINGRVDRLMAVPNGPYIAYWEIPRYDTRGGWFAPMTDWPRQEDWEGVPLQAGEEALDPDAPDGTYSVRIGRWRMKDGSTKTFYAVNVNKRFVSKVGEASVSAPTYDPAVHGETEEYLGN